LKTYDTTDKFNAKPFGFSQVFNFHNHNMAPTDDLKAHAASSQDFYALLDVSPAAADNEIRRAYRRAALKYHPDKIANPKPADIDKFHLLQIAYDVLSDAAVRQLYDNAREARERKKREVEMMDAAKRKMKEDLEARERAGDAGAAAAQRGLKRTWMMSSAADNEAEEKLEREIQRIAENSQRRRREAEEKLMKEAEEEEKQEHLAAEQEREERDRSFARVDRSKEGGTNVPELERAVKVHWIREGPGEGFDKDRLKELFSTFGKVENTFLLKDKRQRVGDKKEKKTVATGVVVFTSIVSAHSAVLDSAKRIKSGVQGDWAILDSVVWASGTGPDLKSRPDSHSPVPGSETPIASPESTTSSKSAPFIPPTSDSNTKKPAFDFASLKKGPATKTGGGKPSFASFSARPAQATTSDSSTTKNPALITPSLQEITLMRLKTAQREKERKALEEQLRREDEAADTAAQDV
jgi:DnaJ family protein C protein 17